MGERQEGLHLIGAEAVGLQPASQRQHVLVRRAGVCRDEVRNEVLLFSGGFGVPVEQFLEAVIGVHTRLHHFRKRTFAQRFRGNLEITPGVMGGQFFDVLRVFYREVISHAGSDQYFFDAGHGAGFAVERDERRVVGVEVGGRFSGTRNLAADMRLQWPDLCRKGGTCWRWVRRGLK